MSAAESGLPALAHPAHPLDEHLWSTAERARAFAAPLGAGDWAALAARWHDLGKYRPAFQTRIRAADGGEAHLETLPGKVRHAIVGALYAASAEAALGQAGAPLAYLIAGHHAGLPDWHAGGSGAPLAEDLQDASALEDARRGGIPPELLTVPQAGLQLPDGLGRESLHLWLRMLFSCMVDADFLDTEAALDARRASLRGGYANLPKLFATYEAWMADRFAAPRTHVDSAHVNTLRQEIRAACLKGAEQPMGLFSLTVPTGGGKTLASLGFALRHAVRHGLRRIIYVIPYTSIIEQTADVFRAVFAGLTPDPVIEHHSNLDPDLAQESARSRLATENWDAPIIVTTSVQFFESLYAARPSRCRKLHNLLESVVILDEAQLLPPEHLAPVLSALRQLVERYRVSLLLSTATQPALAADRLDAFGRQLLRGLGTPHELMPDPTRLYAELKRVHITLPASPDERREWSDVAAELAQERQVLCIVNRRDDAETLWRELGTYSEEGRVHLSARMCGAHRAETIRAIKQALPAGQIQRVISTQLVEAGVDFDFPVVWRAMAGLDSLVQAAGRCNRGGRLVDLGRVIVFNPPRASPPGLLLMAEEAARNVLYATQGASGRARGASSEPLGRENIEAYFDAFYSALPDYDRAGVMKLLGDGLTRRSLAIQFRSAAEKFRLIPDQGERPVFVQWGEGEALIAHLRTEGPHRELLRRLQRYSVTLYRHQWQTLLASGELEEHEGFLLQKSAVLYHAELGLLPEVPDYQAANLYA